MGTKGKSLHKDLVGKKFGRLSVVEYAGLDKHGGVMWRCICDCGKEKIVMAQNLRNGRTKSCGAPFHRLGKDYGKKRDLTGMRFGKLVAVERLNEKRQGCYVWRCVCDCGGTRNSSSHVLLRGESTSCNKCKAERIRKSSTTHGLSKTKEYRQERHIHRRELERLLDVEWTTDMASAILYFYQKCVVCGDGENLCIDHVYPLEMGYGLKPGNATVLCVHHNSSKSYKLPEELDDDFRDIVLHTAEEFKIYWELLEMSR